MAYTASPQENLEKLKANGYPGRVLVQGFTAAGLAVQAYAIGGRSTGSKNRVFSVIDGVASTESFDTSLRSDPTLTIYDAMRRVGGKNVVSNGDQTATVVQHLLAGRGPEEALRTRDYEPDAPNFTPRITGVIDNTPGATDRFLLSIIRNATGEAGAESTHTFWTPESDAIDLTDDIGYALHTYEGDGDPLPSFSQDPFTLPLRNSAESMAVLLWDHLDEATRVAVVARTIAPNGVLDYHVINGHHQEAA